MTQSKENDLVNKIYSLLKEKAEHFKPGEWKEEYGKYNNGDSDLTDKRYITSDTKYRYQIRGLEQRIEGSAYEHYSCSLTVFENGKKSPIFSDEENQSRYEKLFLMVQAARRQDYEEEIRQQQKRKENQEQASRERLRKHLRK
ncbi:hypothetical protein HYU22_05130 [Candidatus Woesearchaeota archaeon]|nr:hypothetical protein [Candidatus Woesearchaeota archaeon]